MVGVSKSAKKRVVGLNDRNCVVGQDHPRAVLTNHDVDLMLELREQGYSLSWLAKKFEVSKACAQHVCSGYRRAQVVVRWVRR